MYRKKTSEQQQTLWIAASEIVTTAAGTFWDKLDGALESMRFSEQVDGLCRKYYRNDEENGGRPGIDPVVYFKMLLVGFFENISSQRGIAARCADSLSIRRFLHYELTEATPHHSSLTVIGRRLGSEVYEGVFGVVLGALKELGLVRGRYLGIDASTLEANASLRSIRHRVSGKAYAEYVRGLAEEAGVDPEDEGEVRRFDRNRAGRKTSNTEWEHPHDPDAKVGRTKRGRTRMLYKPEHMVDLESGAIVDADIRPGDEGDTTKVAERILDAEERINRAVGEDQDRAMIEIVVADKGYYALEELERLQEVGIKTVVPDRIGNRRMETVSQGTRYVVRAALRSVRSLYGKRLLKRRGMYVERSFAHVLDHGGARRTTLRGREKIRKRYLIQAMGCNLSLLLRKVIGVGTLKQGVAKGLKAFSQSIVECVLAMVDLICTTGRDRSTAYVPVDYCIRHIGRLA